MCITWDKRLARWWCLHGHHSHRTRSSHLLTPAPGHVNRSDNPHFSDKRLTRDSLAVTVVGIYLLVQWWLSLFSAWVYSCTIRSVFFWGSIQQRLTSLVYVVIFMSRLTQGEKYKLWPLLYLGTDINCYSYSLSLLCLFPLPPSSFKFSNAVGLHAETHCSGGGWGGGNSHDEDMKL